MENYSNETGKWMSLTEMNKGLNSNSSGDYANSAELNQGLGHITNMVATNNALGFAPVMGQSMPTNPHGSMPASPAVPESMGLAGMPGTLAIAGNPSNPHSMPSSDFLSGFNNLAMANMGNLSPNSSQGNTNSMNKQVISEPCTISQPMNASLRESHSNGGFYFLPNV